LQLKTSEKSVQYYVSYSLLTVLVLYKNKTLVLQSANQGFECEKVLSASLFNNVYSSYACMYPSISFFNQGSTYTITC